MACNDDCDGVVRTRQVPIWLLFILRSTYLQSSFILHLDWSWAWMTWMEEDSRNPYRTLARLLVLILCALALPFWCSCGLPQLSTVSVAGKCDLCTRVSAPLFVIMIVISTQHGPRSVIAPHHHHVRSLYVGGEGPQQHKTTTKKKFMLNSCGSVVPRTNVGQMYASRKTWTVIGACHRRLATSDF